MPSNWRKHQFAFLWGVVIVLLMNTMILASQRAGLIHFPVKNATEGRPISIEARVEDRSKPVQYMRLYFRTKGQPDFRYVEMDEQMESYIGDIPAKAVQQPGVEYFVMALLEDQTMATNPLSNPYYAPYEVAVFPDQRKTEISTDSTVLLQQEKVKQTLSDKFDIQTVILSPEPNTTLSKDEVIIAVSFLGETEKVATQSIKLFLDGKDFTKSAEITQHVLTFVPANITMGEHAVRIELSDIEGNRLKDIKWQFNVAGIQREREKFVDLPVSGDAFAEVRSERVNDRNLSTNKVGSNMRGKFGGINFSGHVFFTSRENPDFQPRNRMTLEAGTTWIGVKLGDTYPRFNELMLYGRRVRGVQAYLKLGFFNLEFVQGETNRKISGIPYETIPGDSLHYKIPGTDSVVTSSTGIYKYGTYKQNLMAIRPSFGGGKYFQLGFNLVKVKDDPNSVQYSSQPKDNIVVGPDLLIAFDNHRIEWKTSVAFSLLANDISGGAINKDQFEDTVGELPFDPKDYENYFVLNTSLIPIDPRGLTSLAYQSQLRINYFNNNITAIYKSIGGEYYSLGNLYLRKDIQGFSIYDRIRLYRNQIFLNLGYEKFTEGLSYTDDGNDLTVPTDLSILNIGVSWYPMGRYLPKINLNWKNYDRNNGLSPTQVDTNYIVDYKNKDISIQLGYDISVFGLNHYISISHMTNEKADGLSRIEANLDNNIQMFSLRTKYQIPLTTVINYAKNKNVIGGGTANFKYNLFGFSAIYNLLNNRLKLKGGYNMTAASGVYATYVDTVGQSAVATDYKRSVFDFGGSFEVLKQHQLLWDFAFIRFDDQYAGAYNNRLFRIRYQMRY